MFQTGSGLRQEFRRSKADTRDERQEGFAKGHADRKMKEQDNAPRWEDPWEICPEKKPDAEENKRRKRNHASAFGKKLGMPGDDYFTLSAYLAGSASNFALHLLQQKAISLP